MSWLLCIGRLVSKTDNVMHFARLVKQPSVDSVSDWYVFGAYMVDCPMRVGTVRVWQRFAWVHRDLAAFSLPRPCQRWSCVWIAHLGFFGLIGSYVLWWPVVPDDLVTVRSQHICLERPRLPIGHHVNCCEFSSLAQFTNDTVRHQF